MPKKKRRRVARRRAAWLRATLLSVVILLLAALIHVLLPPATPDVYGGLPQPQSLPIRLSSHVLRNEGFSLAYSEWWRTPLWVAYRLSGLPEGASPPRPDHCRLHVAKVISGVDHDPRAAGMFETPDTRLYAFRIAWGWRICPAARLPARVHAAASPYPTRRRHLPPVHARAHATI